MTSRSLVLVILTLLVGTDLGAQERADLEAVEALAGSGRTDEARALLMSWWEQDRDDASRRELQRGFWLRGRLTVDPAQAEIDFQRLVIEFPGGPYSDLALLRLAQAAYAAGDPSGAETHVARLVQEYPGSSVRREAQAWLATAGPPPGRSASAGVAEDPTPESVAASPGPTEEGPVEEEPLMPETDLSGIFAVQLGAFASEARARAVVRQASDAGFQARLARVEGSRLLHVRVGRFETSEDADALVDRLEEVGFASTIVRNAHREEPIGR